jgi:chemotaxis protein methyltransferase CheR
VSKSASALTGNDVERFGNLVRSRSGMEFPPSRRPELSRAISSALLRTGLTDIDALFDHLTAVDRGARDLEAFIASLTVGETHFFRNRPQFDALEKHILPELIARRSNTKRLRIWSAGCASGEEPYSLAILLDRMLGSFDDWDVLVLATDINRDALDAARRGIYREWSFRNVSPEIRSRYFSRRGDDFELDPRIRNRVTFDYLNIVDDVYPSLLTNTVAMDIILCRNVLIYFGQNTVRRVAQRFRDVLVEDGWLIVGHAEPSQSVFREFTPSNFPGTVLYRKAHTPAAALVEKPSGVRGEFQAREKVEHPAINGQRRRYIRKSGLAVGGDDGTLKSDPAETEGRDAYVRAKTYADRLDLEQAREWVEAALLHDPLLPEAHCLRGLIAQEHGHLDDALEAFRRCTFVDSQFALGYYALSVCLDRMNESARARKARENVLRLISERPMDALIPEGDGLTVGRLLDLIAIQEELTSRRANTEGTNA